MSSYDDDERELTYSDLLSARERRDPQFARMVVAYLEQSDPPENAPEEPAGGYAADADDAGDAGDDEGAEPPPLGRDAWTLARLRSALQPYNMWGKNAEEKQALRRETWDALMSAPYPPPRLRLGDLLIDMYEAGDEWSRAQLMDIFREAKVSWGLWKGMKRVYKLVEERHDPEMFGILAWRLDAITQTSYQWGEVSSQTFSYMRRRAWRWLRQLGQSLPELYPQFAVQVLRHYPRQFWFSSSWIANQIWAHQDLIGARGAWHGGPPDKLDRRAFDAAWKLSPEPLSRLLEDAHNDHVCDFAIRGLKADFPGTLRDVDARWLARIGAKNLASVHGFVVELLQGSPEFHQSKLKGLGLHDMVVGLLRSENAKASAYAVEYAKSHAPDIPVDALIDIAENTDQKNVTEFVRARLGKLAPKKLGLLALVRMLSVYALAKLAREKLDEGFTPKDLTRELYVALANGESAQQDFVKSFYKKHKLPVPTAFLRAQAEDESLSYWELRRVMAELGKRKAEDIGVAWLQEALFSRKFGDYVQGWLGKGMLQGKNLDVAWVKSLCVRPRHRLLATTILGNPKWVSPSDIGLSWLLAMARHADETLSSFARRYLLEHFAPDDFALEMGATEVEAGIEKIWSLIGADQAEPVRQFAITYLQVHHPELSATTDEARQLGIKPRLPRKSYTLERVRPLFSDASADVRRLARAIGRHELVRWGDRGLVYQLAGSRHREARALASEALLAMGESDADPKVTPPMSWLSASRVFALAESPVKAAREIALTLIRRHYTTLGGANKLAWLMESPDREVRLFAVRLLWEKHRPIKRLPAAPAVRASLEAETGAEDQRFESVAALQHFLRTVLFGLPPGRMERRDDKGAVPDRPLPASVAKQRLIEVVRDMGVENGEFAEVVSPVLSEFMHSQAKGEWQSCVAALAQMRHAHPSLASALPATGA